MNNKKKYILLGFWVVVFIINTTLVCLNKTDSFDKYVYEMVFYLHNDAITSIFKSITFLGSTLGVCSILLLVFIINKDKKRALYQILAVFLAYILDESVKLIIARPRPTLINLVTEKTYSYPSGHTMVGFVMYGIIIYCILHSNINKHKKILFCGLLGILSLVIAVSRIYLGAHFATDIIGGYAFGHMVLISYILIFRNKLV